MTSVSQIVDEAIEEGVYLFIKDSRLAYKSRKGLSDQLREKLGRYKSEIADYLTEINKVSTAGGGALPRIERVQDRVGVPASFAQQRLWLVDQIDGDSSQYNASVALRLKGDLNLHALQHALDSMVERHEVLRTTFVASGDTAVQVINDPEKVSMAVINLSMYGADRRETELAHLAFEDARKPFDLARDLMLRTTLLVLSEHEHVLLFTQHHIASDGWSLGVLVREFSAFYGAYSKGEESPLPPLTIQYADYAQWQRNWLHGSVFDEQMNYWSAQLAAAPPVHSLPLVNTRPAKQSSSGAAYLQVLDQDLTREIKALCKREGVTLFMLMQTVFALLVCRYSHESDVVIGTPIAGRSHQELDSLIGFFVNNLVLRSRFDGNAAFREVLEKQKQIILEAYAHQHIPFEALVGHLNPQRSLSYDPVFQIVFGLGLNSNASETLSLPNLTVSPVLRETTFAKVDLELTVIEQADQMDVRWAYRTDLFNESSIARFAASYAQLLQEIVADPAKGVFDYSIVEDDQRDRLLSLGRGIDQSYLHDPCAHRQFALQAAQTPDAIAVQYEDTTLTYAQLDAKADCLARYLLDAGVQRESRVGLYLPRSPELLIAVLGVLKAGGAYVPLEPGLPAERLSYMVHDAGIGWVLLDSATMDSLPLHGVDVMVLDGAAADANWLDEYAHGPLPTVAATDLAYVLYTSGSTGQPKGVMVEHQGLSHYLAHAATHYLPTMAGAVVSSPLCFDATVTTLLPPLLVGKPVVVLPDDETTLSRLAEHLFAEGEGWLFKITPAHLEALAYLERSAATGTAAHRIVIGGEQLPAATLRQWKGTYLPQATFINEYGPTETVVGCSVWTLAEAEDLAVLDGAVAAPIGRPIGNTQLYVLGAQQQRQPMHSVGELYIGGAGVARGYLNRPELTTERFIASPYAPNERLYKTGDLVRYRADGELEFIGRLDDQVKIRGFRIELGEIEGQLRQLGTVREAVVMAREDVPGQKRLVAYVVPSEDTTADVNGYREGLAAVLPDYMVPAVFVVLSALPLTPNGKVDKKTLPAPDGSEGEAAAYVAPRNAIEQVLCEVWAEVLKRERVGVQDNFFSVGGDSILSIRIVSLLKSRGVLIAIKDIFQHQTIAQLAPHAQQHTAAIATHEPFALLTDAERAGYAAGYDDAYPLSALQVGMVFHTQLEQFNGIYHDIMAEHVKCPWDRACFEEALALCIQEHPILRTGFRLDGERPLQHVHTSIALPLVVEDLRDQTEAAQAQYLAQWTETHKRHVFDWEHGPLFHIHIFRRTEESFEFVISFHHAVLDGWSRAALTTSLYNRYERLLSGQALEPVAVDKTYRDFIALEQQVLADPAAKAHFATMLEDAPGLQLPRLSGAAAGPYTQARVVVDAFRDHSGALLGLAKQLGVPVSSVLLAAHVKVLATLSGQSRVLSCVTYNGRPEQTGAERGLGLFLNSLPVALQLTQGSWRDLIGQVAEQSTANLAYRHYPLAKIQQDSGQVFAEVLFNYTHFHVYNDLAQGAGQALEALGTTSFEHTNFDLLVGVSQEPDSDTMQLALVYNAQVFDAALITQLSQYYERAFTQMLDSLDAPHASRSLLSDAETQQLLHGWNRVDADYANGQCLHELFEAQVARHPDAVALVYEDTSLTYDALNRHANQVAHYLRAQGVGPDVLVGLCVERSLAMVIGILGILKAGGAYVPLDPSYPADRLAYMLQDSAPAVVLTQTAVQDRLPPVTVPRLLLDAEAAVVASYPETPLAVAEIGLRPEHLAYVIYTSGSTGQPKGVLVEHRHVQRLLSATHADFGFHAQDVWTLFHSYAFDFSVWELWGALAYGGRLVVVPSWIARSPEDFYTLLRRQQVTVLNQTPTAFTQLAQVDALRQEALALRVVVFGGEALNLNELTDWVARHGDAAPVLVNMYGITETTVHVTYRRITQIDIAGNQGSVIGRPLADLTLYVLDDRQGLVPVGTAGEMYVGGGGVSRGYLNRAELTATRFIDNPHVPGERLYRTGDLARYRADGELEYLGRIDAQVKIRGFRIELGEIEQQLSGLPGVNRSVVMVREDVPGQKRLVAYVVPSEDTAADVSHYREGLAAVLPDYMVPAVFVVLSALPLTPNGKVDKKALPAPDGSEGEAAEYVAPRNAIEQVLCEVWAEVLKRERVGVQDNFFSVGGDSILSIRIVSLLKSRGLVVGVKDIFQYQTIAQLAPHAQQHIAETAAYEPFALLTETERAAYDIGYDDAYPLSTLQAGMVFHTQLEQFNGIYHDIMAEHVKCPWDRACFEEALALCIQEHPILRTGFRLDGERPLQHVHASIALPLVVEDLRDQTEAAQDAYLAQWIETRKRHVFDWEHGPLFHFFIFRRTEASFQFVISFHHAVLDGWSRAALTTALYNRYERRLSGQVLEPVTVDRTYRDFIALEQQVLADPAAKAHFAAMLDDVPAVQIPRVKPVHPSGESTGRVRDAFAMDAVTPLSGRLIALAKQLGVPVQSVLLAGHFKVLSTLSGQTRAFSCVTHNGRPEQAGAEHGLGLFLNSLPVGLELTAGSWRALITQVAQVGQASMAYRRYPLAKIQQDMGTVLGEVTFNYTHFHIYNDLTSNTERPLEVLGSSGFEQTNFDFHIDVARGLEGDALWMRLIYNDERFERAQMERVAQYYVRAYEQMLEQVDSAHTAQSLLGETEIAHLHAQGTTAPVAYEYDPCAHRQFALQAAQTPDAIAVRYEDTTLTYAQLDAKADRLARYLLDAGVQRESRVGLYLPRSPELLIAVLGVLKAGGAYVPLEPGLPAERLSYMVHDAGIGWVLLDSATMDSLPLHGVDVMVLDGAAADANWLDEYAHGPLPTVAATDLAYVLYTSGSTGQPKGVMVEHQGLSHYLAHAATHYLPTMAGAVVSSPLCFDATVTTLLPPLLVGKPVVVLPDDETTLSRLAEHLFAEGEGWLFKITPAHLEALAYLERSAATGTAAHRIVIGGEQLPAATLRQWKGTYLPQATFINEYGPTETVVGCSVWTLAEAEGLAALDGAVAAPIGRPIGNTQLYVLGAQQQRQPMHSVGELYIGGAGVARGYLNRPELTTERFIASPYAPNERLYKTGDLVRYRADGELEFIGRLDDQVKIRGFRIELGEIEGQLRQLGTVREAVVMAREDVPGQKRLVAYVVPSEDASDDTLTPSWIQSYRESLAAVLPDYMVPAVFVVLSALPLTPNGKVDKKALPAPDGSEGEAAAYVAPRNAIEQVLCEVWAEVLKRERVGVQDNFFSVGGDSILSIRIVSLLKSRGLVIDIKDIFQHQTIAQLVPYIGQNASHDMDFVDNKKIEKMLSRNRHKSNENDVRIII